jgi:hypothetical protein
MDVVDQAGEQTLQDAVVINKDDHEHLGTNLAEIDRL